MGENIRKVLAFFIVMAAAVGAHGQSGVDATELPTDPGYVARPHFRFRERVNWLTRSTVGPESLVAGVVTSGFGTAENRPPEYGTHLDGFAQRYAIRLSGVATSNVMEAGLGALWGEDPRYYRLGSSYSVGARLKRVVLETFYARNGGGEFSLAYARLIAVPSSNFLSNTWRADSEADVSHALLRTVYGFAGHMTRNAWEEFRPDKGYMPRW